MFVGWTSFKAIVQFFFQDYLVYNISFQLQSLPSPDLPIFMEMVWNNIPEGVNVSVKEVLCLL